MNTHSYLSLWRGDVLATVPQARVFGRDIVRDVAARHRLTLDEIKTPTRARRICWPRQEAMWEIRKRTDLSLPQIASLLGLKDHTTVIHGIKAHAARMCGESAE